MATFKNHYESTDSTNVSIYILQKIVIRPFRPFRPFNLTIKPFPITELCDDHVNKSIRLVLYN
ncbi:hypothetical protein GLOIN_2v1545457 [Rhizophagus irregularis DAOM 181602=DAOM 197198]|uniref:Uncharacterized protein n=1 Tax=Rhizophagus irregularis (strain DAOM 181602 / DAOM 197198 / MUCL 43194) TaxID=747089 RepID=A0A2P4QIT3_RHIID|nr:hypothetical protein GLOIN_2v1545457 [Rhizophagus irregularis DAOM 181602=DAOM 197198]POG77555.1 hypothetical protein GLOIN_2v1545457 [Rhizophagus irregularis DAOM 181602=DAOM 197198]|eukprot:XP_025184421.1 hypothetical protein GLOIN_2v1545457 [Rhizophagus irregularis DAOM 181602=DAOM 197198]